MDKNEVPLLTRYADHLPTFSGLFACLVGIFVFIGWVYDITFFTSIHPSLVAIKPNAAASFFLSGLTLIILGRHKRPFFRALSRALPFLSLAVIGIGGVTLLQYLLGRNLGIDQLLFQEDPGAVETYLPGRMSPLAAGSFLLLGFSHLIAARRGYWSSQFLSLVVTLLGISALFGYGFQIEELYNPGPYTSIALHSAVTFVILGIGTISLFPDQSFIKTIFQNDIGGFVARRLMPAALIIPLFLGLIILAGRRMGFYGTNFAILLVTISTVIIFTFVIFSNARLLSLIEHERNESELVGHREVESAQQRLTFLVKASRILARSLDQEVTLNRIARLSVPYVADWCAIDLVQPGGGIKRVAVKHTDGTKNHILAELESRYPTDPNSGRGVYAVLHSGKSELISTIPDSMLLEVSQDETHLSLIQALGLRSVMLVPLRGREEIFGTITLATAESNRIFDDIDLELAEELGRRAGFAVENARLYEEKISQNQQLEERVRHRTSELEVANLELKTEIVERRRIEQELRESEETLAALVRTASKLITLVDIDKVYEIICEETARALDVPICNIRLFDKNNQKLVFASGFGLEEDFWNRLVSPPNQYEDFVALGRDHQTSIFPDVQSDPDSPNYELFKQYDIRTTVGVSLIIEERLIGRLSIATTGQSHDFSESDLALLRGLADQAALAIQNAQLLAEVNTGRERLRRLNRRLVSAQESERRRISKELHDESGQALTAMKISLSMLKNTLSKSQPQLKEQLDDLTDLADEIMERLRRLAHDLRPPSLETLGLNKSLEGLCRQFAGRTNLSIDYQGDNIHSLPDETTITIYRLVQEALTNVAKHANAHQVTVKLSQRNSHIVISVEDNGQGFSIDGTNPLKSSMDGMGLGGMQERVEFVGGQLEINSIPGDGTEIIASIPIDKN